MNKGDTITKLELSKAWLDTLKIFDEFIKYGNKVRPIRFLVRHILEKKYSEKLVPGTSLFSLLISIPRNNTVDYSKTLHISLNEFTQKVEFRYSISEGSVNSEQNNKRSLKWADECELTEVIDTFEYFLLVTEEWRYIKSPSQ